MDLPAKDGESMSRIIECKEIGQEEKKIFRAGDLTVEFDEGRLLNFSYKNRVIISEVYFALRDYNWNTIPYVISGFSYEKDEKTFQISFHASHDRNGMSLEWDGFIKGDECSQITYGFKGTAESDFLKNRIGFCLLHPAELGGKNCCIRHSDGSWEKSVYPYYIAPHQPMFDICEMKYGEQDDMEIHIEFQGDIFEMEDQRNWTDASFKTYCTPLGDPFPVQVMKGDCFSQSIIVQASDAVNNLEIVKENADKKEELTDFVNNCGFGCCISKVLTEKEIERIKILKLDHLRFDWHFGQDNKKFSYIVKQIEEIGCSLLLALFFTENWKNETNNIKRIIDENRKVIKRIILLPKNGNVLEEPVLKEIRDKLQYTGIEIGSGTDAFFTQLNREKISGEGLDFISYSNNPQVHAFDNASIMGTVEGQRSNIESCRYLYPEKQILVTPITMKMRWNPAATGEEKKIAGKLPGDADIRQSSMFLAAWTMRSGAVLMQERITGATYFEVTGIKGIMEAERYERDFPFPSSPGMIYPVYPVLWALNYLKDAEIKVSVTDSRTMIFWKKDGKHGAWVANNKPIEQEMSVGENCQVMFVETLVKENKIDWLKEPLQWECMQKNSRLRLAEYSVAFIYFED